MTETTKPPSKGTILMTAMKFLGPALVALLGSSGYSSIQSSSNDSNLRTAYEVLAKSNNELVEDQKQDRTDIATLKAENEILKIIVLRKNADTNEPEVATPRSRRVSSSTRRISIDASPIDINEPLINNDAELLEELADAANLEVPPADMIQKQLDRVQSKRTYKLEALPTKGAF